MYISHNKFQDNLCVFFFKDLFVVIRWFFFISLFVVNSTSFSLFFSSSLEKQTNKCVVFLSISLMEFSTRERESERTHVSTHKNKIYV